MRAHTIWGEDVVLVGDDPLLGAWQAGSSRDRHRCPED